ncbi:MAG: hypothetical protein R3B90_11355 [Planctomycetaceae bacterium]
MAEQTAMAVLDRHFLDVRSRLLDIAAALDRIERSQGGETAARDPRMTKILEALSILKSDGADRAERIQIAFSDPYVAEWNQRSSRS